jgi:hypothetical protein
MSRLVPRRLYPVALALLVIAAACGGDLASDTPAPATARATETPRPALERPPVVVASPDIVAAAGTGGASEADPSGPVATDLVFTDARAQAREFIAHYRSIELTYEQEQIKVQALAALPAPCCSEYTMATCCCPCNMAKSVWGLSAWLITEKGYGVEQVRQAAVDWIEFINPHGFTGTACSKGRCPRPFTHDGCGGMKESDLL